MYSLPNDESDNCKITGGGHLGRVETGSTPYCK